MRGKHIVFEGIDGSGTSTQALRLHEALVAQGVRASLTAEPSPGPVGQIIRLVNTGRITMSSDPRVVDRWMAHLYAADRYDHLHNETTGILQRLDQGMHVISTRYHLSSYAYNVVEDEDRALVEAVNRDFPTPDLTFFLDCPLEESLRRIKTGGRVADRFETADKLRQVRDNYERALADYAGEVIRVDATQPSAAIAAHIASEVMGLIAGR